MATGFRKRSCSIRKLVERSDGNHFRWLDGCGLRGSSRRTRRRLFRRCGWCCRRGRRRPGFRRRRRRAHVIRRNRRPRTRQGRSRRHRTGDVRRIREPRILRHIRRRPRCRRPRGARQRRRWLPQIRRRRNAARRHRRRAMLRHDWDIAARAQRLVRKAWIVRRRSMKNPSVGADHDPQLAAHIVGGEHDVVRTLACRLGQRPQPGCPHNRQDLGVRKPQLGRRHDRRAAWRFDSDLRLRGRHNAEQREPDADRVPVFQDAVPWLLSRYGAKLSRADAEIRAEPVTAPP